MADLNFPSPFGQKLNDFLIDEAFVYPLWSNITRGLAKTNLQGLGHRRNEMWTFYNAWLA